MTTYTLQPLTDGSDSEWRLYEENEDFSVTFDYAVRSSGKGNYLSLYTYGGPFGTIRVESIQFGDYELEDILLD